MPNALGERIRNAVAAGVQSRSLYYATIDLPDEQLLGGPASMTQIVILETNLQRMLPPSYRAFLVLHDGWKMAYGDVDLLSVAEMLEGPSAESIQRWQEQARDFADGVAARSLVIGAGHASAMKLLLDPSREDGNGEWLVVGHDHAEEWTCPSFIAWLEESDRSFRELAIEEVTSGDE